MKKLNGHSPNVTQQNIAKLAALFPHCVTEKQETAKDANGRETVILQKAIDWNLLKQELSSHIVEGATERYQLNWPGKKEALLAANAPIAKTLRPCRKESLNFDSTENLFIEGDNLDALKLLQETYLAKVKMIYIDPPYNTGKDFIYKDKWAVDSDEWLVDSGQADEDGNRLVANTDANGRFHSDWLSMMYPRLKLARNLLKDDGVIFISIDDGEQANLRKMCDEIFGADNFVTNVIWEKKFSPQNDAKWFSDNHDHIFIYAKDKENWRPNKLPRSEETNSRFKNIDDDPRGPWASSDMTVKSYNAAYDYPVMTPAGIEIFPTKGRCWSVPEEKFQQLIEENRIWFGKNGNNVPRYKSFLSEMDNGVVPLTIWKYIEVGHNQEARQETKKLFDENGFFDSPKPVRLLFRMVYLSTRDDDIILDFFAGSATTAHAVMQLNAEELTTETTENTEDNQDTNSVPSVSSVVPPKGKRKFIMVQLPEKCAETSEAYKAGYKTIAEISKERIRRAGKKIQEELTTEYTESTENNQDNNSVPSVSSVVPQLDIGFRVLKVDSSNMRDVYYTPDALKQEELASFTDNIKDGRTPEDLLFQVLLDWGVDLTLPISKEVITTETTESTEEESFAVFFVDGNALAACFETGGKITEEFCKALAERQPLRVVFRDSGFADDSVKINAEQIFKLISPHTDIKTI